MQGKCDKSENGHYKVVNIEIQGDIGKEVGTCKFCGKRREYRMLDWTELYNKFNLSKPDDRTLIWAEEHKREYAVK